jgi:hypothetical protein
MPPSRTYTLTPAEVAAIRSAIPSIPSGNTGEFNPPGHPEVTLGYSYDGISNLQVTILHDAWYESAGMIWGQLDKFMPPGSLPA